VELQDRLEELRAEGLGVAAISYDSREILAEFSRRRGITYPLLSDVGSKTITAYGILNTIAAEAFGPKRSDPAIAAAARKYVTVRPIAPAAPANEDTHEVGTPFPGTFIVDRHGRVTSRFFEDFYRERNTAANIMLKLGLKPNSTVGARGSTAHLSFNAHQTNQHVSIGSRFSVAVDVEPRPGMHVYAPGASDMGYRAVALIISPQPFVRTLPVQYPASETYFFEPLDERVPVYQKPFTVMQELVIDASPDSAAGLRKISELTLSGRLNYQACDDRVCFDPASVPLSWTVALLPLDR
jgi:peroxiredoxin